MICECGGRLYCKNTNNDPANMETARMYICSNCGKKIYTMERICNKNTVSFLIQQRYKKYYTDVRKEGEEGESE